MPSNMPPGYSEDGDAASHGRDLVIYVDLVSISERFTKLFREQEKYGQFYNDEQKQKAIEIESLLDDLLDDLNQPL